MLLKKLKGFVLLLIQCNAFGFNLSMKNKSNLKVNRRDNLNHISSNFAAILGACFISEKPSFALNQSRSIKECVYSIERVKQSCNQLEDSIERGEYSDLKVLVKGIVRNYKLEASLKEIAKNSNQKTKNLANEILELLDLIVNYFPENYNNTTGTKIKVLNPEQAIFTVEALKAVENKIQEFENQFLRSEIFAVVEEVRREIKEEETSYMN
mmetsp:Transcript_7736/g.11660  ORF Transcript_7736/g.11660 Transcript_7736/m.11660 type:complete len:211 (-) Transcript_7736:769-1401(-)